MLQPSPQAGEGTIDMTSTMPRALHQGIFSWGYARLQPKEQKKKRAKRGSACRRRVKCKDLPPSLGCFHLFLQIGGPIRGCADINSSTSGVHVKDP